MRRSSDKISDGVKLVIFDLDGTLVDAYEAIIKSMHFTLNKTGYPPAASKRICRAVGWGDKKLLAAFIKEEDLDAALTIYRAHHRGSLKKYSQLLPFTKRVLEYLSRRGVRIAIASNRPTVFTHILVGHLKIKKYFDYILCADKLSEGKPYPEILFKIMKRLKAKASETVFVGDMAVDVQTAHNANVKAIAVLTGSSALAEIKKAKPFIIIKSLAFLKNYLSRFDYAHHLPR